MQSDSSDDDDEVDLLSVAEDLCLASALLTSRNTKITRNRIRWQQTNKSVSGSCANAAAS
jgi:hypothetical protein